MTYGDLLDEERLAGMRQRRVEDILELLEDLGPIPAVLPERLGEIHNDQELSRLHKLAAKVQSVDAFMQALPQENVLV